MQFNNGKCFLFHHYQNNKDRNPRSMQEQSRGCRFTFLPCLYIIQTQLLPSRVHARGYSYSATGPVYWSVWRGFMLCCPISPVLLINNYFHLYSPCFVVTRPTYLLCPPPPYSRKCFMSSHFLYVIVHSIHVILWCPISTRHPTWFI